MSKFRAIALGLATVLAAFVIACDAGADPRQPGHDPGGEAPAADPILTLKTDVPAKCSPYTVTIDIKGGQGIVAEPTVHVAAGPWSHDITYRSGARLLISLGVFAKPGCADGHCEIVDGPGGPFRRTMAAATGSVVCQTYTKR